MTSADREKELRCLVRNMRQTPSQDHSEQRDRAWVLRRLVSPPAAPRRTH